MSELDKNIYRKDESSPYEKIVVNPIEKDRREKEPYTSIPSASSNSQTFATLISYFKKILSAFVSKGKSQALVFDFQHLIDNIIAFRKLLTILSLEDQSHNPDFTQQLSELWHILLDDCNSLSSTTDSSAETMTKIKFFISQIQNFPLGADHTLGYYFNEYAGKDWIPFPFMELLQQLHEEFRSSPTSSALKNWISLLNEILGQSGITPD